MRVLILSNLCFLLIACGEAKHEHVDLEDFALIEGEWSSDNRREVWSKNDTSFYGEGFENGELFEKMWILHNGEEYVYRVQILQSGAVKEFSLLIQNPNLFHFVLPENDFPSEIIYYFDTFSDLKITLVGKENNEETKLELGFTKKPS